MDLFGFAMKKLCCCVFLYMLGFMGIVMADVPSAVAPSAVSLSQCSRLKEDASPFILVLHAGQKIKQSINHCLAAANVPGAIILNGMGSVEGTTLQNYNPIDKNYHARYFAEFFNLENVSGNFGYTAGVTPFTHLHVSLGRQDFSTISGHLDDAIVAVSAEIAILPTRYAITREPNKQFRIPLISTPSLHKGVIP